MTDRAGAGALGLPTPYLLFLGDVTEEAYAKTAFGLRDWAAELCVGEYALPTASVSTGLKALPPRDAVAAGARSLLIGVANSGGVIPHSWVPCLLEAVDAGLDIVSGLHTPLAGVPGLSEAAERVGRRLIEVRRPPASIPVASGRKRAGKRLLTVGTDCALGKKYTALALARAFQSRGVDATFRATGQTGIMIAGGGMPMDAVVADFAAGAAEMLSPDAGQAHWDVIEGQGSLFHPAYAGVSLALLHGSQPDVIVVCHQPDRTHLLGNPSFALPSLEETIELNLRLGSRTNPAIRCAGISLNTSHLDSRSSGRLLQKTAQRLNLPVIDPMRLDTAMDEFIQACLVPA